MARVGIVCKWGNSLGVRIPSYMVNQLELKAGNEVAMWIKDNYLVIGVPKTTQQKDDEWLENLLASQRAQL